VSLPCACPRQRSLCRGMARNCTAKNSSITKNEGKRTTKISGRQRPLRTHGKENIDGKTANICTAKPMNMEKHKRHRRARLCLVFLINARQSKPLLSVSARQRYKNWISSHLKRSGVVNLSTNEHLA
jgi:hypothetical protein